MNPLDFFFKWRRDRREARQDLRDEAREHREARRELLDVVKLVLETAPNEDERAAVQPRVYGTVLAIASQLEQEVLAGDSTASLQEGSGALVEGGDILARKLERLAEDLGSKGQAEIGLEVLGVGMEMGIPVGSNTTFVRESLLAMAGRIEEAISLLDVLAEDSETRRFALKRKVVLLEDQGRVDQAEDLAREMLAEKTDAEGLAALAWTCAARGNFREARTMMDQAVALMPREPNLQHLQLAFAVSAESEDVRELVDALLDREPENPSALGALVKCYVRAGDLADAETAARKLVEVTQEAKTARILLAHVLEVRGDYLAAIAELDRARESDFSDWHTVFHLTKPLILASEAPGQLGAMLRRIISLCSNVIENPKTPVDVKAAALILRGLSLLVLGAREIAMMDLDETTKLEISERMKAVLATQLNNVANAMAAAHEGHKQ